MPIPGLHPTLDLSFSSPHATLIPIQYPAQHHVHHRIQHHIPHTIHGNRQFSKPCARLSWYYKLHRTALHSHHHHLSPLGPAITHNHSISEDIDISNWWIFRYSHMPSPQVTNHQSRITKTSPNSHISQNLNPFTHKHTHIVNRKQINQKRSSARPKKPPKKAHDIK